MPVPNLTPLPRNLGATTLQGGDAAQPRIYHQTQKPQLEAKPPPSSPLKLRREPHPSSRCLCTLPRDWPHSQDQLSGATGSVTLSLAVSSWKQISYFGPGRRERSRGHPAAARWAAPGKGQKGRQQGGCPAMLRHRGSPARGKM